MLYVILLVKSFANKEQIRDYYHKMSLLRHPDAGGRDLQGQQSGIQHSVQ